jgi:hypothetical protein
MQNLFFVRVVIYCDCQDCTLISMSMLFPSLNAHAAQQSTSLSTAFSSASTSAPLSEIRLDFVQSVVRNCVDSHSSECLRAGLELATVFSVPHRFVHLEYVIEYFAYLVTIVPSDLSQYCMKEVRMFALKRFSGYSAAHECFVTWYSVPSRAEDDCTQVSLALLAIAKNRLATVLKSLQSTNMKR